MINIVRFNWPIYVFVICFLITLCAVNIFIPMPSNYRMVIWIIVIAAALNTIISLGVSHYIYDLSDMYLYNWLDTIEMPAHGSFANIHSGFDETSAALKVKFPQANWQLLDFYDPVYNTEKSILRARTRYPSPPETKSIDHKKWDLKELRLDVCFCLFAVHEIRDAAEKTLFFRQAAQYLKPGGKIIMAEHQRDLANFLAFGYGFFHFFSTAHWRKSLAAVPDLEIKKEFRVTPFVKIFVIQKNG
jgi:hypothetical protein